MCSTPVLHAPQNTLQRTMARTPAKPSGVSSCFRSLRSASRSFKSSAWLAFPSIISLRMFNDLSSVSIRPLLVLFITCTQKSTAVL